MFQRCDASVLSCLHAQCDLGPAGDHVQVLIWCDTGRLVGFCPDDPLKVRFGSAVNLQKRTSAEQGLKIRYWGEAAIAGSKMNVRSWFSRPIESHP